MRCVRAKSLQSCPTLCDPMDYRPLGSSVYRILQARILEWVAMLSSRGSSPFRNRTCVFYVSCIGRQVLYHQHHQESESHSVVSNSTTPWTVACQVPLSMGFSRPEYWGGLPFPSPGDLPDPRIEATSPILQATPYHLGKPKETTPDGNSNPQKQVERIRNDKTEDAVNTNLVFFLPSASLNIYSYIH